MRASSGAFWGSFGIWWLLSLYTTSIFMVVLMLALFEKLEKLPRFMEVSVMTSYWVIIFVESGGRCPLRPVRQQCRGWLSYSLPLSVCVGSLTRRAAAQRPQRSQSRSAHESQSSLRCWGRSFHGSQQRFTPMFIGGRFWRNGLVLEVSMARSSSGWSGRVSRV